MRSPIKNSLGLTVCLLLFSCLLQAQIPDAYTPIGAGEGQLEALRPAFEGLFEQSVATLPANYKKEYRKLYENLRDRRLAEAENGYFLLDAEFEGFFKKMLATVKMANPDIMAKEVRFYVSRDASPNASTYPDGVILFNIGLLASCENESQAAFVLCHELAHHELTHGANSLAKRFDALYSKQAKEKIANIAKQDNAYEKALAYLKDFAYDHSRHGREHESEADSLAAVLLAGTPYDARQAIGALKMLDTVDTDFYAVRFDIASTFNFPDYPFKAKWLESENTLFQDGSRVFDGAMNKDSLKTHPDCLLRAATIDQRYLKGYDASQKQSDPQGSSLFLKLKKAAKYEALLGLFDAGNIDLCLLHTLSQLQEDPTDVFLNSLAGRSFNLLYAAQKEHVFSRYVSVPQLENEAGYKRWLQFLNILRLRELAAVGYHFLNTRDKSLLQDDEFQFQMLIAAKSMELPAEIEKHKNAYLQRFPKGKHREEVSKY
ncbi:MAG: M48 family metallopeptidase [Saprospiraceae bacterium]